MLNNEIVNSLIDIRIELLHYWQSETNKEQKDMLSNKLNELDIAIQSLTKQNEKRLSILKD